MSTAKARMTPKKMLSRPKEQPQGRPRPPPNPAMNPKPWKMFWPKSKQQVTCLKDIFYPYFECAEITNSFYLYPNVGGLDAFEENLRREEEEREAAKRREEERRAEISKKTRSRLSELLDRKRAEVLQELER